ncbi:hypothetical protein [Craterilacuibacter sp. RT1T]|uniref:hypothetical protein n=1 Tax=Craterilacuibacter sp. RT1T TaxID=2942211 RepID=UPI0020BD66C1|nr:hypothetical protein [Craterilacuibacter sp. RT1T]MCL6262051.1 hypothetical protein [Craterilacuibacter sp. RT1T]
MKTRKNVDIVAHGATPEHILRRLQQKGYTVSRQYAAATGAACLSHPDFTLDLSGPTPAQARQQAQTGAYIDLAGHWHPAGQHLGYVLYAGGSDAAITLARPLLDALAPVSSAWLMTGPAGSATFMRQYMDALGYSLHYGQAAHDMQFTPADLLQRLQGQEQLLERIRQLAQRYLASHPAPAPATSNLPPDHRQPHFAQALAQWLLRLSDTFPSGPN